ncbi:MAG: succinyl-diaminopimelate desuccinylase [Nitrospirota bacterium]|nr:succinyl-diaminopimelate desuccinylase [Nitrospirota bacterium]
MAHPPHHSPLDLARELIAAASVTPRDEGCQAILTGRLAHMGFRVRDMSAHGIANFFARRGNARPMICFAGHTDVVAPGPLSDWTHPPFSPTVTDGVLYGRGAADMKGAIAAALCAVEAFLAMYPNPPGSIAFLITGDEEGDAIHGTRHMVEQLAAEGEMPDFCIVGEPSSTETLGDTIKHGRRGSVSGSLTVYGVQGHVAFPERADNPIHRSMAALDDLARHGFDDGNADFQPTRLQMTDIRSGVGASNVIPGHLVAQFNLRFSPASTPESIDLAVRGILDHHRLKYELTWLLSGLPFVTGPGRLTEAMGEAVRAVTGKKPTLSTTGGTSDARFIAPHGVQVAELGLLNTTIHKVDECVAVADLERLTEIYVGVLERLLPG